MKLVGNPDRELDAIWSSDIFDVKQLGFPFFPRKEISVNGKNETSCRPSHRLLNSLAFLSEAPPLPSISLSYDQAKNPPKKTLHSELAKKGGVGGGGGGGGEGTEENKSVSKFCLG